MLRCSRCKKMKEENYFNKDSSKKRGYSSYCKICKKEREGEIKESINLRRRKYYQRNKDIILRQQKESYDRRHDAIVKYEKNRKGIKKEYNRKRYYANPDKYISKTSEWIKNNPDFRKNNEFRRKNKARQATRRASKLKRTPVWADLEAIKAFYKNCPPGYQVDHIYPLQGTLCSGLHVLENLQYLTAKENRVKSNRMPSSEGV